jgi:hypothetical protein
MTFDLGYRNSINQVIELLVWSSGVLDKQEIEELDSIEFDIYRTFFKKKYEDDNEQKKKFIENTFEFANKAVEVICKTIAGAYGTNSNTNDLKKYK